MSAAALIVNEVFGPTVQGEGPSVGRRCGFVRLGRCVLECSWCDEPQTWDWQHFEPDAELHGMPVPEILERLRAMGVDMLVLTGGEPLLQQRNLAELLEPLRRDGWRIEVETAGTLPWRLPVDLVDQFNVSPKLSNSGNMLDRRYKPEVLRAFEATGRAVFKFVVEEVDDLEEVAAMVQECGLTDVWVMPEGVDATAVTTKTAELAPAVIERGWNLTTRLHILAFGNQRGV